MIEIAKTKMYKNKQTAIPSEIRKKYNLKEDSIIQWNINKEGNPELLFPEKSPSWDNITGIASSKEKTDSVKLVKELYK